jgi:hypothetical protein
MSVRSKSLSSKSSSQRSDVMTATTRRAADPIFAAIEKYRAADKAPPETTAAVNALIAARAELAKTAPTTLAGILAYLDYVLSESDKIDDFLFVTGGMDPNKDDEARNFLRSLSRAVRQISREAVQS